ncbi:GNAT family N-acetyltransferase [Pollutibacter soli]|uniref:GNAT family N-acetyltransferase n=1 Tax=Pollutibacter soli TaxID=3034157 RepID=UPI0030139958
MEFFTITNADAAEYPLITEIWEASVRSTHHFLTEEDIRYFKPMVGEHLAQVDLYVIRESGNIRGFLGLSGDKIEMLFIDPVAFGKGLGKKLLTYAIYEKGFRKVDVNEQNPSAVGFYEHMGFAVTSRSPLDPQGKPFPILHMEWKEDIAG